MFSNPTPARNEFAEPPPQDQSSATLVLGNQRLACRLVEVSIGGFTVMVPNATVWMGEPVGRLVTQDSTFKVRIIKQEARYEGFEATLLRVEEAPDQRPTRSPRRTVLGVWCCAAVLMLAIGYSCLVVPPDGITDQPVQSRGLRELVSSWFCSPPTIQQSGHIDGDSAEMPSITISLNDEQLESPRSFTASTVSRETVVPSPIVDRHVLLQTALATADSRRLRPLNAATLSWLFITADPSAKGVPRCRMGRAAEDDLRQFEAGLNQLSAQAAANAVRSLRGTLMAISSSPASVVDGFPQVRLTHGEDADIYFRVVDGETELLRVLPVELEDSGPFHAPSALSKRRSQRR